MPRHLNVLTIKCDKCAGSGRIPDNKAIGHAQHTKRKHEGIKLIHLAKLMGISVSYLCDLEHGRKPWTETRLRDYNLYVERLINERNG